MNLAVCGIDDQIVHSDTFHNDHFPDLKVDFILANPPLNVSDWGCERLREDKRWNHGTPPLGDTNFAWVQHIVHYLAPAGAARYTLAKGSIPSNQSGEGEIRKNINEAVPVDCMVAPPGQLFFLTQISACLWILARDRKGGKFRDHRGNVLFIDACKRGQGWTVDRTHHELTDEYIARIAGTYHAWRGGKDAGEHKDVRRFCKSAALEAIRNMATCSRRTAMSAPRYRKRTASRSTRRCSGSWHSFAQQAEAVKLDETIARNLKELGYGG